MRAVARLVVVVVGVVGFGCERADEARSVVREAEAAASTKGERGDPARVAGKWNYRTRSNCGTVEGVGSVSFEWNGRAGVYRETGDVHWSDSGSTITWWGDVRYHAADRHLRGTLDNSLGDKVDGDWRLEGERPDRLVVEWNQTNGCNGVGIATR
jgi:hypothetical protein